jgi:hypothetical protein
MDTVDVLRWLLAVPLGLFGVWVTACNYACIYLGLVRREHHSIVPLVGGTCVALAWLLCPAAVARGWAWLPLAIDPGSWVCVIVGPYLLVLAFRRRDEG